MLKLRVDNNNNEEKALVTSLLCVRLRYPTTPHPYKCIAPQLHNPTTPFIGAYCEYPAGLPGAINAQTARYD